MIFYCHHCSQELEADNEGAGMTVLCPNCGLELTIPHPEVQPSIPQPKIVINSGIMPKHQPKKKTLPVRWFLFVIILLSIAASCYFATQTEDIHIVVEKHTEKTAPESPQETPANNEEVKPPTPESPTPSQSESEESAAADANAQP